MTVGSLAGATVLYDADCGWCRWTLAKFLRWDLHDRLPTLTIQSPVGGAMLAAMPVEEHLASWHLVTPHGHVYAGERTRARLTASSTSSARSFRRPGIWEVVDAASTKPCGFMRFEPGPRMGGHCLPVDQFYLSWRARVCHGDRAHRARRQGQPADALPGPTE